MDDFLTATEAAEFLEIRLKRLIEWRKRKMGPPYHEIAGSIRYNKDDLEKFKALRDSLLTEKQAAEVLGIRRQLLIAWRQKGSGPRFIRFNNQFCYDPDTLKAFKQKRELYLTTTEAAKILGFGSRTLSNWRRKGIGPKSIQRGGKYFYLKADLLRHGRVNMR